MEFRRVLFRAAEVATYSDHRMAMSLATLGLAVPGIRIQDPACVAKTFPNFWQKLALPGPGGLGVTLLDGEGHPLAPETLAPAPLTPAP